MNRELVDRIARTVLYEGYMLYPYRPSSLKNSKRCAFGVLYPEAWTEAQSGSDRSDFQMECLLLGQENTRISAVVRFLQFLPAAGQELQEGVEREFSIEVEAGQVQDEELRRTKLFESGAFPLSADVSLKAVRVAPDAFQLRLIVRNATKLRSADGEQVLLHSLGSAHAVVNIEGGRFLSMTDPPAHLAEAASQCVNAGVWPALVGDPGASDTLLASPIILPDYPQVAPESPGDLYDATEIDEILTLRILTLTDEEKAEVRRSDDRARSILERSETLPAEHLMRLHGAFRSLESPSPPEPWSAWDNSVNSSPVQSVRVQGRDLKAGDRVRLRPTKRADIFDAALAGRVAIIASIEQDFEDNIHVAVVIEDDPGRDLGEMRQIGHRFFFSPFEIELLESHSGAAL